MQFQWTKWVYNDSCKGYIPMPGGFTTKSDSFGGFKPWANAQIFEMDVIFRTEVQAVLVPFSLVVSVGWWSSPKPCFFERPKSTSNRFYMFLFDWFFQYHNWTLQEAAMIRPHAPVKVKVKEVSPDLGWSWFWGQCGLSLASRELLMGTGRGLRCWCGDVFIWGLLSPMMNPYLVGGLEHEFYDFPFSWEFHHPNCYSLIYFSEG